MDLEKSWSVEERHFQLRPEGTAAGGGKRHSHGTARPVFRG